MEPWRARSLRRTVTYGAREIAQCKVVISSLGSATLLDESPMEGFTSVVSGLRHRMFQSQSIARLEVHRYSQNMAQGRRCWATTALMDASGTSNRTPRTPGQFRRLLSVAPRRGA